MQSVTVEITSNKMPAAKRLENEEDVKRSPNLAFDATTLAAIFTPSNEDFKHKSGSIRGRHSWRSFYKTHTQIGSISIGSRTDMHDYPHDPNEPRASVQKPHVSEAALGIRTSQLADSLRHSQIQSKQ